MKKIITLLIISYIVNISISQELGIINDPDGFTNIRAEESANAEILGQLKEGEQFQYFGTESSSWWKIRKLPFAENEITGFVHNSRIQPYYVSADTFYSCFWLGDENIAKPILTASIDGVVLGVCGFLLQRHPDGHIKADEFSVVDFTNNKELRASVARRPSFVQVTENGIEIIRLETLPSGPKFEWRQIPYSRTGVLIIDGVPVFSGTEVVLDLSEVSTLDILGFEQELLKLRNGGSVGEIEEFLAKLAVASLKGSAVAKDFFENITAYLDFALDGYIDQLYDDFAKMLE